MYVTLGQLRAFERIVRLGSFHAAALELKLSQPSVSQRIRELEAALNTPLFVRRGPRVSLTAEGHALIEYADRMRTLDAQGVAVESGDVLCLHTGQSDVLLAQGANPDKRWLDDAFCHLDGCDERLLRWIDASNIAAIAADNFAVEAVPPARTDDGIAYERLHELCLFKLGMGLALNVPACVTRPPRSGDERSRMSARPATAPTAKPPPMILPRVVRSGRRPSSPCTPL